MDLTELIVWDVRRGSLRAALNEIIFRHSLWEASGGKEREQLDLSRRNLRKVNLREARLDGANCQFAVFLNADFEYADLRGVDTRRAHTDRRPHTEGGILIVNEPLRPVRQLLTNRSPGSKL